MGLTVKELRIPAKKKKKKKKKEGGVAQSKHMFAAQMIVMEHPSPEV
jgi:hypothetical protein